MLLKYETLEVKTSGSAEIFQVGLALFSKICFNCFNKSISKMTKNAFSWSCRKNGQNVLTSKLVVGNGTTCDRFEPRTKNPTEQTLKNFEFSILS